PQSGAMLHVCPNRRVILLRNTPHRSFPPDGPDYVLPTTSFTANPIASASSHPRNLSVWKRRSTIQRTFAIQQPRPQHLPRGLIQRVFSQPLRLSAFRLPLPHGSPQRSAKNTLPYVTPRHTEKLRKWPPNTCGMGFDSLIVPSRLQALRRWPWA